MRRTSLFALAALAACVPSSGAFDGGGSSGGGSTGGGGSSGGPSGGGTDAGAWVVSTLAGGGGKGLRDGRGRTALFDQPTAVALDGQGHLYVADTGNGVVRQIDLSTGDVSTLAPQPSWDTTAPPPVFGRPTGVAVDSQGDVFVSDPAHQCLWRLDPTGVGTVYAGIYDGGVQDCSDASPGSAFGAQSASISAPSGLAVADGGVLFFGDVSAQEIRWTDGTLVGSLAGEGDYRGTDDGACAENFVCGQPVAPPPYQPAPAITRFDGPTAVAEAPNGDLFVTDTGNCAVRWIRSPSTGACEVLTFAGAGGCSTSSVLQSPAGVAVGPDGRVYVADTGDDRIVSFDPVEAPPRQPTVIAGGQLGSADGVGTAASFAGPAGLAVDSLGRIYVADPGSDAIRLLAPP